MKGVHRKMKNRLDNIDWAKGLLIILAVIGHIWQAGTVHNFIYAFHMPAFFVISGMLMRHTRAYEKNYLKFLFGKAYAFGIQFLFFEMLGVLTEILRHGVALNIKGYIFNTVSLQYNDSNMWFLVALFLIEALFSAAKKLLKKDWAVGILCGVLFAAYLLLPHGENRYVQALMQACHYLLFFATGFYAKAWFEKENTLCAVIAAIIPVVVSAIYGRCSSDKFSLEMAAFVISGFAGTYAVLQLSTYVVKKHGARFVKAAGQNSMTIYGTHHVIYAAVGVVLGNTDFATTPLWAGLIMLLAVTVAEPPIIYAINRWVPFLAGKRYKKQPILQSRKD